MQSAIDSVKVELLVVVTGTEEIVKLPIVTHPL